MTVETQSRKLHSQANIELGRHYSELFRQHGDSPQAAQWPDRATQEARFTILNEVSIPSSAKILDFGCGLGDALGYLRKHLGFQGEYVGYDLSEEVITHARAKYSTDSCARFEQRDIFSAPPTEEFDYTWICGTFNIRSTESDAYIRDALRILFGVTRNALAFNLMSTYVDFFSPNLHYADPENIFRFCKEELSPCVTLRHDYLLKAGVPPYEFAMYVYRVSIAPRLRKNVP